MPRRERLRAIVENHRFQQFIIAVIVANAITLAMQTSSGLVREHGSTLEWLDTVMLTVFVVELVMKLIAYGPSFFRDLWNVFDFVIVAIALVPASGPFAVLRALRVLRLISAVPAMKKVVTGLLAAIPGMASIAALLGLILFVSGVMATNLFGGVSPQHFGDLGTSLFSLFQTMTGEAWPDIAGDVMAELPAAWIFFVVYILISTFAVLNLFIAVVVSAMEEQLREEIHDEEELRAKELAKSHAAIMAELRSLRAEVAQINGAPGGNGHARTS